MNYEELVNLDPLKEEYLRIYQNYQHACSYEDFLLRKKFVEDLLYE